MNRPSKKARTEELFIVEKIKDICDRDGKTYLKVKWEDSRNSTEEPLENIKHVNAFQEFQKTRKYLKYISNKKKEKNEVIETPLEKTKRDAIKEDDKFKLLQSQDFDCSICNKFIFYDLFEVDHVIPLNLGGSNNISNLQILCLECHMFKSSKLDNGFIKSLIQAKNFSSKKIDSNIISTIKEKAKKEYKKYKFNFVIDRCRFLQKYK